MPDLFNRTGLKTKSLLELRDEIEANLRIIYGSDINLDQNSPDGQFSNIVAQLGVDTRELMKRINASFDPEQAEGVFLDQRVAINGIQRLGGSFTTVTINVITNRSVNLIGLNTQSENVTPNVEGLFIVRDNAGNRYFLLDTVAIGSAGTYPVIFRAEFLGDVLVNVSTITTVVTVTQGIVSITNPSGALVQGRNEETDAQLRTRRKISTAISSIGNITGLEGALSQIAGVSTAIVDENITNITDANGIPPHSIWAIVEGGDDEEIARTIKGKKTAGAGMKGDEEVNIPYNDGRPYVVKFDRPNNEDLYIRFDLNLPGGVIDNASIKEQIVNSIFWPPGADARSSVLIAFVQALNPNYVITGMEVSDDDTNWLEIVSPGTIQNRFVNAVSRITIT